MSKQKIEEWLYENERNLFVSKANVDFMADIIHQYSQNLLDRLDSKDRKIKVQDAELKKIKQDHKALAGLVKSLRDRNKLLKALLARMADETENGHDKIEAWRAVAEDCRYLD